MSVSVTVGGTAYNLPTSGDPYWFPSVTEWGQAVSTAIGTGGGPVPSSRTISTTSPLSGGGDLTTNRTLTTSMATNKLIGRGTAGTGVMEQITLGTNLSFSGTTLNAAFTPTPSWDATLQIDGTSNTEFIQNQKATFNYSIYAPDSVPVIFGGVSDPASIGTISAVDRIMYISASNPDGLDGPTLQIQAAPGASGQIGGNLLLAGGAINGGTDSGYVAIGDIGLSSISHYAECLIRSTDKSIVPLCVQAATGGISVDYMNFKDPSGSTVAYVSKGADFVTTGGVASAGTIQAQNGISVTDGKDITFGGTSGTKIGGSGSKLGFYNATPITQPTNSVALDTLLVNTGLRASGGVSLFDTDVKVGVAGKGLYVKEGSNCTMGTATFSSGTVTVSTTKVTANSRIQLTVNGGTLTNVGSPYVSARTAGTSFAITSTNASDASNVAWIIMEPA